MLAPAALGLSGWLGWLDYVLIPTLGVFAAVTAPARMSHQPTAADADLPAPTALRSAKLLDVLFKYACAPLLSRALYLQASSRPRFARW